MQIGYSYVRPVDTLYARALGPYKTSAPAAWSTMLSWLDKCGLRAQINRGYGVINDNPGSTEPHLRRYDACVELIGGLDIDPSNGIGRRTVPGGAYAVHRHVGRHRTLGAGFSFIHRKWVPGQGLQVDPLRPYLEIYLSDPAVTPEHELQTDLCVPVFPISDPVLVVSNAVRT